MNSNRVESGSLWVTSGRVLTLAFGCVLLLCGVATGSEKCGSIDRVATALQLVKAVYPEFQQQELDVGVGNWGNGSTLPTDGRSVLITIAPDSWHPPQWWKEHPEGPPPANTPVVWRDIELPVYLSFDFVKADGTLNYTPRCRPSFMHDHLSTGHRATIELVNAHPEWNDEEALAAAKRNGLRFGPEQREKLLAFLPLKALSAVYGPLQIKKAKLRITTEHEKDAKFDFAIFNWELTANEIGTRRRLYISVDPFDGRIWGIQE